MITDCKGRGYCISSCRSCERDYLELKRKYEAAREVAIKYADAYLQETSVGATYANASETIDFEIKRRLKED